MKMNKVFKSALIFISAITVYSLIPVVALYVKPPREIMSRNEDVIDKLKDKKGAYFEFIVISDTGSGLFLHEAVTLKVISFVNREDRFKKIPIDFVINIGDVTYRGKESHYENYLKLKQMFKYPVIDAIGNHDDDLDNGAKGLEIFNRYCGAEEFSFVNRNSYFIVLDNKDGDYKKEQFAWLESELQKSKEYAHRFIFMHKPPFNPFQESWYRVETNPWSYEFMKLCEKHNVDMVLSGHESGARVAEFGGVKYLVSGGGGTVLVRPSWQGGYHNYIVVKVNGDYLDYEIRQVPPPIWELFIYHAWKDLIYIVRDIFL